MGIPFCRSKLPRRTIKKEKKENERQPAFSK